VNGFELRWFQKQAIDSVYQFLRDRDDNPCIEIPTGGGKTPIIATIATDAAVKWGGRVCLLSDRKELLSQTANHLRDIAPGLDVGIFSASLGEKTTRAAVTVAQIQSIYSKAFDFEPFNLILVDEAHGINPSGEGRYCKFLADCKLVNPKVRLIGLTATPYRLGAGDICGPSNLLNEICFRVGVKELINEGFLCPLTSKEGQRLDVSGLHVRQGEYVEKETERLMLSVVGGACVDLVARTAERKSTLIFCCSVAHAEEVADRLRKLQARRVELVTGGSLLDSRDSAVADFRAGEVAYLVNVDIFTTGFDAPNVDCVAMLRPTLSPGLYYQMVGRGFRIAPGKTDCLVLDYSGNIERHGPVDDIRLPWARTPKEKADDEPLTKTCAECKEIYPIGLDACPACGAVGYRPRVPKHDDKPSGDAPVSGLFGTPPPVEEYELDVEQVRYSVHSKKGDMEAPRTLRVDYWCSLNDRHSEWVCLNHEEGSYAWNMAMKWLALRYAGDTADIDVARAVEIGNGGGFREPLKIHVKKDKQSGFPRLTPINLQPAKRSSVPAADGWEFPVSWKSTFAWFQRDELEDHCRAIWGCSLPALPSDCYQELADACERAKAADDVDVPF
jgi:DNA repair protein RadD